MYHRFHDRFGTAGVVIAVIALVVALGGTALAAGALTSKQKKEVTKIAKKYAGKPGAPGATGPAGANGTNGTNGEKGAAGANGTNGTNGKNVVVGTATSTTAGECPSVGGATIEVEGEAATKKKVCNGSPWTAGGTLPSGSTETGVWAFGPLLAGVNPEGLTPWLVPISFPIPLAEELDEFQVHYLAANGKELNEELEPVITPTQCLGSAAEPSATLGNLCVYTTTLEHTESGVEWGVSIPPGNAEFTMAAPRGTGTSGAVLGFGFLQAEARGVGTWAVTAE